MTYRLTSPQPKTVILAILAFACDQTLYELIGRPIGFQGPLDETAHLLTTLFIFWAIRRPGFDRLIVPALVASVAIDLDHIPGQLGYHWLATGTSRPYTHSLATVVALVLLGALWRRRRRVFLGLAVGVASHLFRDLAEPAGSGIALVWPVSDATWTIPAPAYLAVVGVCGAIAAAGAMIMPGREERLRSSCMSTSPWPETGVSERPAQA